MKKKFLVLLLVLVCGFALSACFESGGDTPNGQDKETPFTVTFETNGGTPIEPVDCTKPTRLKNILNGATTTKAGKVFNGWFCDEALTEEIGLDDYIYNTSSHTLYAGWRDYTDGEILENAVMLAYKNAVAVTDSGFVRTGTSTFAASTVDAVFTLSDGKVLSASNGTKFYDGEFIYFAIGNDKIKTELNESGEVYEFIYHNEKFKSISFFQAFSPLVISYFAGSSDTYPVTKTDTGMTVEYKGNSGGIAPLVGKYKDCWIYFDGGNKFEFTLDGDRLVSVKQSGSKPRTITFYYQGDELPLVAEPQDKDGYELKWQLMVDAVGGGTSILYKSNINKEELDKEVFGAEFKPQTSKLTYYENKDMTKPIKFAGGIAELDGHTTIYHPGVDRENTTVAYYEYTFAKTSFTKVSEAEEDGVLTTTLRALQPLYSSSFYISANQRPYNAKNRAINATFVPLTEEQEIGEITLTENDYGTQMSISFPKNEEYLIKIESTDGTVCQYIRILP